MLYEIIYASAGRRSFDQGELGAILEKARDNNAKLGVTGLLLYEAGTFFQVLEGDERIVVPLFQKIAQDGRHYDVRVLRRAPTQARHFGKWTMGFVSLDARVRALLPDRHALSSNGSLIDEHAAVLSLIEQFRGGRFRSFIL